MPYDRERTIAQYGDRINERLDDAWKVPFDWLDLFFNWFETSDPTNKKAYVVAMVEWFCSGSMKRWEDAALLDDAILRVEKYRNRLKGFSPKRVTFDEFLDIADTFRQNEAIDLIDHPLNDTLYKTGEAIHYIEDDDFLIVNPLTFKASFHFGGGTRWCTAVENEQNIFWSYKAKGPLFIVIHKADGQRWQLHFEEDQFMDQRDEPLPEAILFPFLRKHFEYEVRERGHWYLIEGLFGEVLQVG